MQPLKNHVRRTVRALATGGAVLALTALMLPPAHAQIVPNPEDVIEDTLGGGSDDRPSGGTENNTTALQGTGEELVGVFNITAGSCNSSEISGSYFRMVQPGGTAEEGPYIDNGNSNCSDKSYTPMSPGTDGGLATSGYQENPDPEFDAGGGSRAGRIFKPLNFQGVAYGGSTNPQDPQSGTEVPVPSIVHDGTGGLSGQVTAVSVAWNRQHFNQGAPKPDGSSPGITETPQGTYDPATGNYVIEWTSTIKGGPFDGFAGFWHLEGTFEGEAQPADGAPGDGGGSDDGSDSGTDGGLDDGGLGSGSAGDSSQQLPFTGPAIPPILGPLTIAMGLLLLLAYRWRVRLKGSSRRG